MIAVLRREWRRFTATPRLWWFCLLLPLALSGLLLAIFIERLPGQLPIALVELDRSAAGRQIERALDAAPGLAVRQRGQDLRAAASAVRRGEVYAVLVVPAGFERALLRGERPGLTLFYNRQTLTAGNLVLREVRTAVGTLGAGIGLAQGVLPAVRVENHAAFNPGLEFGRFLALPLLVALLHVLMVIVAIDVTGRELREASAGDWRAAAGGRTLVALLGKLLPYLAWFTVYGLLIVLLFARLLGLEVQGSLALLALGWLGLVLACFGLGVFLVGLFGNLRLATSVASVLVSPAFAYSGMTFPASAMEGFAAFWSLALPLGHYLHLQAGQMLLAAPPATALAQLPVLAIFALLPMLTLRRWHQLLSDPAHWGRA